MQTSFESAIPTHLSIKYLMILGVIRTENFFDGVGVLRGVIYEGYGLKEAILEGWRYV